MAMNRDDCFATGPYHSLEDSESQQRHARPFFWLLERRGWSERHTKKKELGLIRDVLSTVKVHIRSRIVTVEGPRGKLVKDLSHIAVTFGRPEKDVISIELHHGARKGVATLRTVRTLINNLIIGVTRGFLYKMRYVYAHFPINVNIEKNAETGQAEIEIRYGTTLFSVLRRTQLANGYTDGFLFTVTSSVRSSFAASLLKPVLRSPPPPTSRMSSSSPATPWRLSPRAPPTFSRSAVSGTRISVR